jgi:hypothetical protein
MTAESNDIAFRSSRKPAAPRAARLGLLSAILATLACAQPALAQATALQISAIADQASGVPFQVIVTAVDGSGVPTPVAVNTTVSLTRESGTGALGGGGNRTITAGTSLVTYPAATWTTAGAGKSVRATATAGDLLAPAVSNLFTVIPGVPYKLVFAVQPASSVAGVNLFPRVAVQDVNNNTVAADPPRNITLTFQVNPTGATLNGTVTVATSSGLASWTAVQAMNITRTGTGYRLLASHDGPALAGPSQTVQSNLFNITPAAHHHLAFSTQPANTMAGNDLLPAVRIRDIYDNDCTATPNRSIQLSIITNPGGASLSGTATKTTSSGVATWTAVESLDITVPAVGYQLRATNLSAALPGGDTVDSAPFNITHNVAHHMAFTTHPVSTAAGAALLPAVTIQDVYDNTCTTDNRNITLAFAANPGGGTLNGTVTLLSVAGVAAWSGDELMNITVAANGYQLRASHDGPAFAGSDTVDSDVFDITAGAAHHLAFTTHPADPTAAGAGLLPAVTIQDAYDNTVTGDDRTITLSFAANPGGAALNGTISKTTAGGIASWEAGEGLHITIAADGYRLRASHDGASFAGPDTADSNAFNIIATAAHHLEFSTDPVSSMAGEALLPAVTIQDAYGNTVTGDERIITLILMNANGATLNGTASLLTTDGVAQWTVGQAMNVTTPGIDYYLRASHNGAAFGGSDTADSASFAITHNVPHHLAFTAQPVNTISGQNLLPEVTIQDAYDNTCDTDNRTIILTIAANPGGAALNGTAALISHDGVAAWTALETLNITNAATGYTLRATGSGVFSGSDNVESSAFNITADPVLSSFTVVPGPNPVTVNNPITLTITARDVYGNAIPYYVTLQTVRLTSTTAGNGTNVDWDNGPATLTDHLDGTADLAVGTTFDAGGRVNLDITNRRAETITVHAEDAVTPVSGTSPAMSWSPWFPLLLHIVSPGTPVAGVPFDVDVYVTDQFENLTHVTQDCDIRLRLSAGTGVLGGTVDGKITAGTSGTTVSGATYNVAESNVVLVVDRLNGDFLVAGTSDPITVTGAAPVALRIDTIASQTAGTPFDVTVRAVDGFGNEASVLDNTDIGLQLLMGVGVLSGTITGTMIAGTSSITISGVELNTSQTAVVLRAGRTGGDILADGDSNAFLVSPGTPSKLTFELIGDQAVNVGFIVTAQVLDDYDNVVGVTADTDVMISLATGTGTLKGTLSRTIPTGNGSIVFSVTYDTAEAGVSLRIDRTSGDVLNPATSNVFTVDPSSPVRLRLDVIGRVTAASPFSVTVVAVDLAGNDGNVSSDTTVLIALNSGNGRLRGTSTGVITAGSHSTTVSGLIYDYAETISLRAASIDGDVLSTGISDPFSVSAGPAAHLLFAQQPVNTVVGASLTVMVEITDAIGNRKSFPGDISLSLLSPSGCPALLDGTIIASGFLGLATFDIRVLQPCDGCRLSAAATGLTGAESNPFAVTAGTDIVGNSVDLMIESGTTELLLTYTISGMSAVVPFRLRWGLERDVTNAEAIDEVFDSMLVTDEAYLQPTMHTIPLGDVRPYLNGRLQLGDQIVVQIDVDDSVSETREDNNLDSTTPTVNLVNQLLKLRPRGDEPTAEVTYVVNSPVNVWPFKILIGLDNDGDGGMDAAIAESTCQATDLTPGVHVFSVSLLSAFDSTPIASGKTISLVAQLNPQQEWPESEPLADNLQSATMSYPVDLALSALDHVRAPHERIFEVKVSYELSDMPVSEDFIIAFYASVDNDNAVSEDDIRIERYTISNPADKTHGLHTRTFRVSVPMTVLPGADFVLKARLDDADAVTEVNETNNAMAMPRYTPGSTRHLCGLIGSAPLTLTILGLVAMRRSIHTRPRRRTCDLTT